MKKFDLVGCDKAPVGDVTQPFKRIHCCHIQGSYGP